jgi:hypothetical protein
MRHLPCPHYLLFVIILAFQLLVSDSNSTSQNNRNFVIRYSRHAFQANYAGEIIKKKLFQRGSIKFTCNAKADKEVTLYATFHWHLISSISIFPDTNIPFLIQTSTI